MIKAGYSVQDSATYNHSIFYKIALFTMHDDYNRLEQWLDAQRLADPSKVATRTHTSWWIHEHVFSLMVLAFGAGYVDD